MRNLKRVLSLALALVMVLGMMVITTSAADFTDADEITYKEAVEVMSEIGILKGMGDGTFAPKATLNRAQAAKILAFVCMGTEADEYLSGSATAFDDVAADHWATKYITYCANLGIVNGNGDGTFNPDGTLTVVQFAKMLLVAIEAEGTFTGAGWENNVKKAYNGIDELKNTGIKVTNANVTREEACELALAAMKAGEAYSNGWYYEGKVTEYGYAATYSEMFIMAKAMEDTNFVATNVKKHSDTRDSLLETRYDIDCYRDTDAFGRPGTRYEYTGTNEEIETNLFFQDTAVKTYVGTVKGGTLWADLGEPEELPTTSGYEDGRARTIKNAIIVEDGTDVLCTNPGRALTGNGTVTEVYAAGENAYTFVVINTYTDVVATVNEAQGETKANIVLTTDTTLATIETDKFAEGDAVLYTKAWDATASKYAVQEIEKAEATVKGTPTKNANGVYTIGDATYPVSFKGSVSVTLGTEGEWYTDGRGNLIANVGTVIPTPDAVYTYRVGCYTTYTTQTDALTGEETKVPSFWAMGINANGEVEKYAISSATAKAVGLINNDGTKKADKVSVEHKLVKVTEHEDSDGNVFYTFDAAGKTTGTDIAATALKIANKEYFSDDVKFVYVSGDMTKTAAAQKLNVTVKEGVQAVTDTMFYVPVEVKDAEGNGTGNYTVSYVFVAGKYEAPAVIAEGVVFANESDDSTSEVLYINAQGKNATGYEHTVYIDGVATTVVTTSKTALTSGFITLTEVVEGVYSTSSVNLEEATNLKAATKVTNMFNGMLSTKDITDKNVADVTVINTTNNTKVPTAAADLTTDDTVAVVLSADGKTVVTIYVTASDRT